MKNIFIILVICFFTNSILGQDYQKQANEAAKDRNIPASQEVSFKANYIVNAKQIAIMAAKAVFTPPPFTTDICDDGGFETKNFSTWGWTAINNIRNVPGSLATTYLSNQVLSANPTTNTILSTIYSWEIVSAGSDPNAALPKVHSGNKALKIGSSNNYYSAESVMKTINVTASNANLTFWYALVLQDPGNSHTITEKPYFGVRIHSAGSIAFAPILPVIGGMATSPIIADSSGFWILSGIKRIRPWTCASVNLSQYIGKQITIEFLVSDCSQGMHYGYAYIDDICMGCAGSDMGDASLKAISKDCGPTAIVDGAYTLPHNATTTGTLNSITAQLYQGGSPIGSIITIPSANINNATQTFNFSMSLFGAVPVGNYDIVIKAYFTLSGSTFSTISNLNGVIAGVNNDWKSVCPPPQCCHNKFSVISAAAIPPSYPYSGGTYSIEDFNVYVPNDIPLTEIKVNVESFEIISAYKDCLKCDNKPVTLGSLFGVSTIGTGADMLTLTTQPYGNGNNVNTNNNELIWSNINGVTLNTTDKLSVVYLLPSSNDIPCCATKAKVCIRISWRDIDCNYCEVFTCSTIDLKNPKDLKPGSTLPNLTTLYLNSRGVFVTGHADGF
ncbi:hypothetical protein MCEGE10_02068 [Flavobacteriaceae bacterium]